MTDRAKLIAHHVGARGLNVTLDCPELFDDGIVHVLYEGDPDAAQEMARVNAKANVQVLPHCLGRDDGQGVLHITENPYGSSLYRPNPDYGEFYGEVTPTGADSYDSIVGDWCRVVKDIPVEIRSLDRLLETGELDAALTPDFLSLDTQGSELDILMGARKTLRSGVVGIAVEVEFAPIYQGQPLAADILSFMASEGFHFAGFLHIADEVSPHRAPLGQRGRGLTAWGDALFLRRLDKLESMAVGTSSLHLMARKLAFIAVSFGFVEYGLAAMRLTGKQRTRSEIGRRNPESLRYQQFLDDLSIAAAAMDSVYLPTDRPSPHQGVQPSQQKSAIRREWKNWTRGVRNGYRRLYRYLDDQANARADQRLRQLILSDPTAAALKALCYVFRRFDKSILSGRLFVDTSPLYQHRTAFERVLYNYQFHDLCRLVRHRRLRTINRIG